MEDPITPSCDWLYREVSAEDDERPASISRTEERNAPSRMTPHHPPGHHGSERAWLSRWLELSTQRLRELHVMRQEAEDRVRGVLEDEHWTTWRRNTEDSMGRSRTKPRRNQNPELGHIQEEEIGGAIGRAFTPQKGNGDPQHSQGPALTQELLHRMSLRGPPENWNQPMGPGRDSLTMGDGAQVRHGDRRGSFTYWTLSPIMALVVRHAGAFSVRFAPHHIAQQPIGLNGISGKFYQKTPGGFTAMSWGKRSRFAEFPHNAPHRNRTVSMRSAAGVSLGSHAYDVRHCM